MEETDRKNVPGAERTDTERLAGEMVAELAVVRKQGETCEFLRGWDAAVAALARIAEIKLTPCGNYLADGLEWFGGADKGNRIFMERTW